MPQALPLKPSRAHLTRLMKIWRSAGWPSQDAIEIDLLAAQWVEWVPQAATQQLRLTQAGIHLVAQSRQQNQRAASAHDRLGEQLAKVLLRDGRIVWRELSLRAQVGRQEEAAASPQATLLEDAAASQAKNIWRMARPDVFSLRNTSVARYLQPQVHEIKASRADLLSDLRHEAKRAAYRWLSSEVYYVFPAGMAEADEIPPEFGVWLHHGDAGSGRFEQLRAARHQDCELPFAVWLALAKATPLRADEGEPEQAELKQQD